MTIEITAAQLVTPAYRAFVRARIGARTVTLGPGQHLDDLVLDFEALPQEEKDAWETLASRIFGLAGGFEGQPMRNLARAAAKIWEEITGAPAGIFQGPNLLALDAFCRTIAAFLDSENESEDVEELCAGHYDWTRWGKLRQEQLLEAEGARHAASIS